MLPAILVAAAIGSWGGVVVAQPAHGCRRVRLPESRLEELAFHGSRVAYPSGSRQNVIWTGTVGAKLRALHVSGERSGHPVVWAGNKIAYYTGRVIHVVGGGTIAPRLPAHASIIDLAAHGSRFAVTAGWGDGKKGTLKSALFVITNGVSKKVEDEPDPYGEIPHAVWSPDGTRIAIVKGGDLWTIAPDGSSAVQLSRTPKALEGDPIWSPDSRSVAYWTNRHGVIETYAAPDMGGVETRLTHTTPIGAGVPQVGTRPGAWRGDRIAVTSYNAVGVISDKGGPVDVLCRQQPVASTYLGPVSW